jgi:type IV fimbrial biogenesis protein FimT
MKARGFTLIEVMVSVAIVAILASIAVPNVGPAIATAQVRSSADQLRDMVARARQEAVKRNVPVTLSASDNVVTLAVPAFGTSPALQLTKFVPTASISNGSVTMTGSGRADVAAAFQVTSSKYACKAADGPVLCLTVKVFTGGAARMCDPTIAAGSAKACS